MYNEDVITLPVCNTFAKLAIYMYSKHQWMEKEETRRYLPMLVVGVKHQRLMLLVLGSKTMLCIIVDQLGLLPEARSARVL